MTSNLTQVPKQEAIVAHYDNPLRFMVQSRSASGKAYLVDLGDHKYPFGSCQCRWFITNCGPAQLRGERRTCYHIERARSEFADWAIEAFRKQDLNISEDAM